MSFALLAQDNKNVDPIVGTWKSSISIHALSDGALKEFEPDVCFSQGYFVYQSDGTLNYTRYKTNKKTGECEKRPSDFWTGTWKRLDDGSYRMENVTKFSEEHSTEFIDRGKTYTFIDVNTLMITQDVSNWNIENYNLVEEYHLLTRVVE